MSSSCLPCFCPWQVAVTSELSLRETDGRAGLGWAWAGARSSWEPGCPGTNGHSVSSVPASSLSFQFIPGDILGDGDLCPGLQGAGLPAASQGWWVGVSLRRYFSTTWIQLGFFLLFLMGFFFLPLLFCFALPLNEFEWLLLPEMVALLRDGSAPTSTARPSVCCSFFILLRAHLCPASLLGQ